jgi:hypothetical protein
LDNIALDLQDIHGLVEVHAFNDPMEEARRHVPYLEALDRYQADPGLLYVERSTLETMAACLEPGPILDAFKAVLEA